VSLEAERIFYVNGEYVPESQAKISVTDHAFNWGDGLFDAFPCWEGKLHKLDAHLDRLYRGAQALALTVPLDRAALREAVVELVRRNGLPMALIKIVVSRGVRPAMGMDPRGCIPTVVIQLHPLLHPADPWSPQAPTGSAAGAQGGLERLERGLKVKTTAVRRTPPECLDPRIKTLNYLNLILARMEATASGADEGLMLDTHGRVCEGSGYNVAVVHRGEVSTPRDNILEGITRQTLLEICARDGIPAHERDLSLYDVYTADEVFFCSTMVTVMAVTEVDGRRIGSGRRGPLTKRLYEAFIRELTTGPNLIDVLSRELRMAVR
jgi:branched-chain amino acid aminotransferase